MNTSRRTKAIVICVLYQKRISRCILCQVIIPTQILDAPILHIMVCASFVLDQIRKMQKRKMIHKRAPNHSQERVYRNVKRDQ